MPAAASAVCGSEWHWRSILLLVKSTGALYSSSRPSGMEMRPWPWQSDRRVLVGP